jgi:hypothetical protein
VVAPDGDKEASLVRSILQKAGFEVTEESPSSEPAIALAVVDADGRNSGEVVAKLHDLYPAARVLLLSEDGDAKLEEIPAYGHIRGALRKPFKRSQLLGSVLDLMEKPLVRTA